MERRRPAGAGGVRALPHGASVHHVGRRRGRRLGRGAAEERHRLAPAVLEEGHVLPMAEGTLALPREHVVGDGAHVVQRDVQLDEPAANGGAGPGLRLHRRRRVHARPDPLSRADAEGHRRLLPGREPHGPLTGRPAARATGSPSCTRRRAGGAPRLPADARAALQGRTTAREARASRASGPGARAHSAAVLALKPAPPPHEASQPTHLPVSPARPAPGRPHARGRLRRRAAARGAHRPGGARPRRGLRGRLPGRRRLDPGAAGPYLDLVDLAVAHPEAPGALAAAVAGRRRARHRIHAGLRRRGPDARRVPIARAASPGRRAPPPRVVRLGEAASEGGAGSPALPLPPRRRRPRRSTSWRSSSATRGAARAWGARRGCAKAATVIGPLDWTPLRGLDEPSPIAAERAAREELPGHRALRGGRSRRPWSAPTRASSTSTPRARSRASRAVVVDLAVPRPETIHLALTTSSAAVVDVGGVRAIRRGFEAGGRPVMRFATVSVPAAGAVRVVVRVAQKGDGGPIELDAWGDDGQPLASSAPRARDAAAMLRRRRPPPVEIAPPPGGSGTLARRRGAARARRRARRPSTSSSPAAPARASAARDAGRRAALRARASSVADDLPDNKIAERAARRDRPRRSPRGPPRGRRRSGTRASIERRRGAGEGITEALRALGAAARRRGVDAGAGDPDGGRVRRDHRAGGRSSSTWPRRRTTSSRSQAPGSPLLAARRRAPPRRGAAPTRWRPRATGASAAPTLDCFEALRERGDFARPSPSSSGSGALRERARRAPRVRAHDAHPRGRSRRARSPSTTRMLPGERRMLEALGFAAGAHDPREAARAGSPATGSPRATAPTRIGPLVRALGIEPDPAPRLEEEGRKLVLADQRAAFLPAPAPRCCATSSGTASTRAGSSHFVQYDLRRVSGTTDVAQGAIAYGPAIEGRTRAAPAPQAHPQARRAHPRARRGRQRLAGERPLAARAGRLRRADRRGLGAARRHRADRHRHARSPARAHQRARGDHRGAPRGERSPSRSGRTRCSARPRSSARATTR